MTLETASPTHGDQRNLWIALVAGVSAVSGVALIAYALSGSGGAPQPPPSAAGSLQEPAVGPFESESIVGAVAVVSHSIGQPSVEDIPLVLGVSAPVSIEIPAIGVRSPLHPLGLTATGALQVPSGSRYNEAAWYENSSTPGSVGPAVIMGHVDSERIGPSVFYRLGALKPGDLIFVTRNDGQVAIFEVNGVRSFSKDHFPTFLVYGDIPYPGLRLITCGGDWDARARSYRNNTVVFASLVAAEPPGWLAQVE